MSINSTRVVVAMSGGVDSSVAAALLVEQGYDVVGMMMRLWSEPSIGEACNTHNRCCTPDQLDDARRIADQLGIPFYVLDTREVFRTSIVDFFIEQHKLGVTPNPCIECNRTIRFNWLYNHARALDADYVATGHYARVQPARDGSFQLLRGLDGAKDQSYVLSVLNQEHLAHALFPCGDYTKPQIRELARRFGLPTASKHDSQDLCFLGDGDYRRFLRENAPEVMQPGPIVLTNGTVVGEHNGLANYTIGQRKGLGIYGAEPLFVLTVNPYRNALVVGTRDQLGQTSLTASRVSWQHGLPPSEEPFRAQVKIRYKSQPADAWVTPLSDDQMRVEFDSPLRDITPGQGAVVYNGDLVLGVGIIEKRPESEMEYQTSFALPVSS